MNTRSSSPFTLPSTLAPLRRLVLGGLLFAAAPVFAEVPWVGFSSKLSGLVGEVGTGTHAPGAVDHYGFALAAGDFNGDGFDDLAAGIPFNDCDSETWDCGGVDVRFGWSQGALGATLALDPVNANAYEVAEAGDWYGFALAAGDFDGDGYDDLAVGVPGNEGLPNYERGMVHLHHGLPGGSGSLEPVASTFFVPYEGLPGTLNYRQQFGYALAFGDFNGDGRDELAVGAPRDSPLAGECGCSSGSVMVIEHQADGGDLAFEMVQGDQGLPDEPEEGERFGAALATGDFNGDGYDDLAIGVPQEDDTGAVLVVYGSPWSLLFANHRYIGAWDFGEPAEPGDHFGDALATGDWNGDGYDDLAIGVLTEDGGNGTPADAGFALAVYGAASGLGTAHTRLWEDDLNGPGSSEPNDYFGSALVSGDFNADGYDDLAIAAEGEDGQANDSGATTVVLGTAQGLVGSSRNLRPGAGYNGIIPDSEDGHPLYGFALASGDFDGNGFADLVIGAPNRDLPAVGIDVGGAAVFFGSLFVDGFEGVNTDYWSSRH